MEFQYTAQDKNGKRVSSVATADAIDTLVGRLKNQGLIPLRVSEVKSSGISFKKGRGLQRGKVKAGELAVFTRQLSSILNAGVLLTEALHTIAEDMENRYFGALISQMVADINSGEHFSLALSKYPAVFPSTFVAVVRSGEEVGNLGMTLGNLAQYLENYERMRQKLKNAMMYPLFLSGFLVFVVAVIVLFLIPKFKGIFSRAGAQLPLLTRIVVGVSEFCLKNMLAGIIFAVLIGILAWYLLKIKPIRFSVDRWALKLPLFGSLIRKAMVARFCHTFSILLEGGVGITVGLSVSGGVVNNLFLQQIIEKIKNKVVAGGSLDESIRSHGVFPKIVAKMVAVGEKSGKLDDMLKRSAEYYDAELETTLNNFSSLIEPVFIVLIGAVVLIVVLALYLPIFKMSMAVR